MRIRSIVPGAAVALAATVWVVGAAAVHAAPPPKTADVIVDTTAILSDTAAILQLFTPKRAFVTNQNFNGNLGGVVGADAKCQTAADNAGVGGVWQAWVADDAVFPDNMPSFRWDTLSLGPYFKFNGVVIDSNFAALFDQQLTNPLSTTETGVGVNSGVWTGILSDGQVSDFNCTDWSTADGGVLATVGNSATKQQGWTSITTANCASPLKLYCFEQ